MSAEEIGPTHRRRHQFFPALPVIALGIFFLLGNLGIDLPLFNNANWWAWFILLGAAWPLYDAIERYRADGAINGEVLHSLFAATAIVMVALMFILSLSWQVWWPLFVIYGGLSMLVGGPRRHWRDRRYRGAPREP